MEELSALDELRLDIEQTPPGPEREELERTLVACQELQYAVEEGFICVEETEDEELMFFHEEECHHAPPIEA